jgi:predicted TIM-barrel fold metal-dependent hydrolase
MVDGGIVIDAAVHPYNLSKANWAESAAREQMAFVHKHHTLHTMDPATWLTEEEYLTDFPIYACAHAVLAESDCDMGILHSLPNLGFTAGPVSDLHKMAAIRDRWPDRFLLYGTLDTYDVNKAIKQLEYQVNELRIDGLKFYAAIFYDREVRQWRMDDPNYAIPILEAAHELGIRNVAVYKATPFGAPVDYYKIGDMETPITRFPKINFQMVHAGYAFIEEMRIYMHSYKNFYANLESTLTFASTKPRLFAEVIGAMLFWGSADQILFASGLNILHPRPALEALVNFEMPRDLIEGRGYPELTPEIRRKILGENAARLHGINPAEKLAKIKDDEFAVAKRDGLRLPWSGMREYARKT